MADPGFPIEGGGHRLIRVGVDLRCGCFSVNMYIKMKELGPLEGLMNLFLAWPRPVVYPLLKLVKKRWPLCRATSFASHPPLDKFLDPLLQGTIRARCVPEQSLV